MNYKRNEYNQFIPYFPETTFEPALVLPNDFFSVFLVLLSVSEVNLNGIYY